MIINWKFVALLAGAISTAPAFAQTSLIDPNGIPFGQTRQQARGCQGKQCPGVKTAYECGTNDIQFSPNPIQARQGQPMTIRFDATTMCNGQTIENFVGTVKWETGGNSQLSDAYGFATYTYTQAGQQQVGMQMNYHCKDVTGSTPCSSQVSM